VKIFKKKIRQDLQDEHDFFQAAPEEQPEIFIPIMESVKHKQLF